ncbi:ribbon-helix-helix domain-containing protein [Parafrigoribacterium humi]|uniref:ribbon-helix-helix domain-containing protein n=1 Tax=Parafrigoribacterium humi TaxID=3144664 RepID=UPI0032EC728E
MKLSVSLPQDTVAFVDEQVKSGAYASRSSALRAAVSLLRQSTMTDSYAAAWDEWEQSGEDALWDAVAADGLAE